MGSAFSGPKAVKTPHEENTEYMDWTPGSPYLSGVADFGDAAMPESLAASRQARYDRARQRLASRGASAYGEGIPASARIARTQQAERDLLESEGLEQGQATQDAYLANYDRNLARRMGLAQMTLSRPLVKRTSGYGTQIGQQEGWLSALLTGAQRTASMGMGG